MCALLNFIKVFCIVLHIVTFHSLRWSIYSEGGHNLRELQVAASIYLLILATGKKWYPDFDFVHQ